jgi:dTDP-glucose pyrophosphorylase
MLLINTIEETITIKQAMTMFNKLASQLLSQSTLFVLNSKNKVVGVLTEGDIRRALLNNFSLEQPVKECMNKNFKYFNQKNYTTKYLKELQEKSLRFIPFLNGNGSLKKVVDLHKLKAALPIEAVIMAGGRGERLRPLTAAIPKPMLMAGNKPILEHAVDYMIQYGITNFHFSVNYLKEQIVDFFNDGTSKDINIKYVIENNPLGTIGSISLIKQVQTEYVLVQNADLITNINYEEFYNTCLQQNADIAVATIPYHVDIPYAILETKGASVKAFKEKPRYTYQANAGIYLIRKSILKLIPKNKFYNATDLIDLALSKNLKVASFPILGFWTDIGRMEDYNRIQLEITQL